MKNNKRIKGFSKLSKRGKIRWIVENFYKDPESVARELKSYWHGDESQQKILDGFSENTISNFPMPDYCVPMVIEESSVVAAAAAAAKFWQQRGGIQAEIIDVKKIGQVHFSWEGDFEKFKNHFSEIKKELRKDAAAITKNMEKRGGGIDKIELLDLSDLEPDYFQLKVGIQSDFSGKEKDLTIIMAILSNYTPDCLVRAKVECAVEDLGDFKGGMSADQFAQKFAKAVRIAKIDPYRATTHNKGIYNGIDAVVLATGNDFRAVESCGHTYASRDGQYRSLSDCKVENGTFKFWLDVPMSLGTVGGLTKLHPIAKRSLELLGNPGAEELMMVTAAVGLAQNFSALRSLVTTGIQEGHMKMHLTNILNHYKATEKEEKAAAVYFDTNAVSFSTVREYLEKLRGEKIVLEVKV